MNALAYLAQKKVNIELLLHVDNSGVLYIGMRLRPWKQDTRNPQMVLAQGVDIQDCLNNIARNLYNEQWRRLDFATRPWAMPTFDTDDTERPDQLDFLSISPASQTPLDIREAQRAIKKNREAHEPS